MVRGNALLHRAAERITKEEMAAHGVPFGDLEALEGYVVRQRDLLISTRAVAGRPGRPPTEVRVLACLVAALDDMAGERVVRAQGVVAIRFGVSSSAVRDADENLRLALREADPSAGAEVFLRRRQALIDAARAALAQLEGAENRRTSFAAFDRARAIRSGNGSLFS